MTLPKHVPKLTKEWRKSSWSDKGGDCVEARHVGCVEVRDSKCPEAGQLTVPADAWQAALERLRRA